MYTFKKNERLGNYRLQSLLFDHGKAFFQYPFRVQYLFLTEKEMEGYLPDQKDKAPGAVFIYPAKCLVSVSKRQIKQAVQRNQVKRLVREAYRKNKYSFYTFLEKKGYLSLVAFVYTADKIFPYSDIEEKVKLALVKLEEKFKQEGNSEQGSNIR